MTTSSSYQDYAQEFMQRRNCSEIGVATVLSWSASLSPNSHILDLGCGSGKPIGTALAERGFMMYGIDASDTLISAYRIHLPQAQCICEDLGTSSFFDRQFNGVIAIGLLFLLPEHAQIELIEKVAKALQPNGRFLFTAPIEVHQWQDVLTGTNSVSLGRDAYLQIGQMCGLELEGEWFDEGENHYYAFLLSSSPSHTPK